MNKIIQDSLEEFDKEFGYKEDEEFCGSVYSGWYKTGNDIRNFLKSHLQLAYEAGYTKGLNLRKDYNDPELLEQIRQQAYKEGYEAMKKEEEGNKQ